MSRKIAVFVAVVALFGRWAFPEDLETGPGKLEISIPAPIIFNAVK